jgi:hypothetical protein
VGHRDAIAAGEVTANLHITQTVRCKHISHRDTLLVSDFQNQHTARSQPMANPGSNDPNGV